MLTADTADQAPSPALTLQQLRNATELLEREVIARGRATDAELDVRRPGSAQYPDTSPDAWLGYVIWLSERNGTAARAESNGRSLDQVLHEALADTPVPVTLTSGETIAIHPKSLDALCALEGLDADLQQVQQELATVAEGVAAGDEAAAIAGALFVGALLKGKAIRFYVWILAHPGARLPFGETQQDPQPPEWTGALTGMDLEAIVRAHLQVNRTDLDFLAQAFPAEERPGSSRLPLSAFLGGYANEIGKRPRALMRNWTLRSVFAGAIVRAQAMREATAAAARSRADN